MRNYGRIASVVMTLLVGLLLTAVLPAAQIHIIMVGDTTAKDLKASIAVDLQTMERHISNIARYTGMSQNFYRLSGIDARSSRVLDHIHRIQPAADDVVFFYFSGHGYRTPSKEGNPWPNIYFASDQTGIDLLEIATTLNATAARLVVVLADCCNSSLPNHLAPPVSKGHKSQSSSTDRLGRNYRKLFVDTTGLVMIASSKAGQPSWSITKAGSLYTCAYFDAFGMFMKSADPSFLDWQYALDQVSLRAHKIATYNGISQDPIYHIQPK